MAALGCGLADWPTASVGGPLRRSSIPGRPHGDRSMLVRGSCSMTDPRVLHRSTTGSATSWPPTSRASSGTSMPGINNYWHGSWIPHPVQMHLYGLPTDLVVNVIRDFVAVHSVGRPEADDYESWLRAAYRGHLRRDLSAGLRAQVPHNDDGPADHGLARTTDVSAKSG